MSLTTEGSAAVSAVADVDAPVARPSRLAFMDNIRYLMVVLVVLYHSVAAYAVVAPHWAVHDTTVLGADIIRELLDVFIMPMLFFVAGYFALSSLRKKGAWKFIEDKAKRLLLPWALAVFVVLPIVMYDQPVKPIRPFWRYWLSFVGGFQVRLRPTQTAVTVSTQGVYWFVSLLFAFFLVLAIGDALIEQWRGRGARIERAGATSVRGPSVLVSLIAFGVLISALYFVSLLLAPDSSWLTLSLFLEFQATRVALFAGCFALGVYAQSRGWLVEDVMPGSLAVWTMLAVALSIAFLLWGRPMFVPSAGSAGMSVGYLLVFASLRSFLLLSVLVVTVFGGARIWNRSSGLDQALAATSFDTYLVHIFVVIALQSTLVEWPGGPPALKIGIVFAAGLALSFALARWVLGRYPRVLTGVILALFAFCLAVRP